MSSLNKVMIIGRLGRDPEMRYTQAGKPVCSLNVDVFVEKKSLCFPFGITQMTRRTFCFNAFE